MKAANSKTKLKKLVREEVQNVLSEQALLSEEFTRSERRELKEIIRNEIADLFYDLFRKRTFWTDL